VNRRALVPSPADIAFLLLLLAASVLRGWQAVNTDGDLGRHLRVGRTILERGGLFYTDLFSFTRASQPFVPYEWLSEVLFALAHAAAGLPGVVALTALVVAGSYLLLALFLRRSGMDPLLAFLVTVAAGMVGAFHWLARPHVFTFAGTVAVLWLAESRLARMRLLALTALLFALWANLHGGFLFGLVLLGMYVAADAAGSRELLPRHGLMLAAALLASMVNPTGPALLAHVAGYLGQTFLVDTTMEYRSPDFHGWIGRTFLVALIAAVAALASSRARLPLRWLAVILGTTAFALHSVRNVPLWGLTALPLVAFQVDAEWRRLGARILARMRAAFAAAAAQTDTGWWSAAGAAALIALAAAGGRAGSAQLLPDRFDPRVFPVDVVQQARSAGLSGRIFNELGWGGYLLYAWPGQQVFIDGQTDFYGEELSREYAAVRAAEAGWRERLDAWRIDLVLLPMEAPLAGALASDDGWVLVANRRNAELYARRVLTSDPDR
jgi:hypothetical protein